MILRLNLPQLIITLLIALSLTGAAGLIGSATAAPKQYVDLDGDGFDDGQPDLDDDGIPDKFQPGRETGSHVLTVLPADVFDRAVSPAAEDSLSSTPDRFALREFTTRGLSPRCSPLGTDDEFGPSQGMNLGAASGGACIGGQCGR